MKEISSKEIFILVLPYVIMLIVYLSLAKFIKIDDLATKMFSLNVNVSAKGKLDSIRQIDVGQRDVSDQLNLNQVSKILLTFTSVQNKNEYDLPNLKDIVYKNDQLVLPSQNQNLNLDLPRVEAVYVSDKGKFVILYGKVLREGEIINGITILSIQDEKAKVKLPNGEKKWLYVKEQ